MKQTPTAICALAFNRSGSRLACGRANGDIEVWNVRDGMFRERTIPGSGQSTVRSLVWVPSNDGGSDRLFSAGLNARLIEWDLQRLCPRAATDSYGGAVWCAALSHAGTHIALACEDGSLRTFDVTTTTTTTTSDDGDAAAPQYVRAYAQHDGRALCVAWSPDDNQLVSGGDDGAVRVWDAATAASSLQMTVEDPLGGAGKARNGGGGGTLVWTVAMLNDASK
jgi:U3 small nucleolar RNA-associated protein 4